jgi:O-antigen ligase
MATSTGKLWQGGELRDYTAHNIFLHVLAGTGLIGLVLFLWGVLRLLQPSLRGVAAGHDRRFAFLTIIFAAYGMLAGLLGDSIVGPIDPTSVAIFTVIGVGTGGLLSLRQTVGGSLDR